MAKVNKKLLSTALIVYALCGGMHVYAAYADTLVPVPRFDPGTPSYVNPRPSFFRPDLNPHSERPDVRGEWVTIRVLIANDGNYQSGPFNAEVKYRYTNAMGQDPRVTLPLVAFPSLAPGQSLLVSLPAIRFPDGRRPGTLRISVEADPAAAIVESNETNNLTVDDTRL